jgi:Domain of unknown function (DUF1707)
MPEPHLRAADSDRAAVAAALGEHMSAGRLTLAEYDERVARAYAAKTYGDLAELSADLPALGGTRSPVAPSPAPARHSAHPHAGACGGMGGRGPDASSAWRAWLTTALIVLTVWGATSIAASELIYFWPIWVIGPWGAVLLASTLGGGRNHGHTDRERDRQLHA